MSKRKANKLEKQEVAPPPKKPKIELEDVLEIKEVFADPTYDATFKMLFGTENNKDILISILNSFLGFSGTKEITSVEIVSSDLFIEGAADIQGSVDVLCTTKNNQKIAVEMQRQYKSYFLPRSQEYMAKIISGQVKAGQGNKYNTALMDTYILSIGKQNIFRGTHALTNKQIFEETVVPWVLETGQEVPGNKMHWKFYELKRFAKSVKNKTINHESSIKEQWLDFLIKCGTQQEVPNDISEIIKKGYEIMKIANWTEDQRTLYWKQKSNEQNEIREQELLIRDGERKGELKGEIKGEISQAKLAVKFNIEKDKIEPEFKHIKGEKFNQLFNYLQSEEHINETPEDIIKQLELMGDE